MHREDTPRANATPMPDKRCAPTESLADKGESVESTVLVDGTVSVEPWGTWPDSELRGAITKDAIGCLQHDPAALLGRSLEGILLTALLGHGGFGTVYLGRDPELDRNVAVKFLKNSVHKRHARYFKREAKSIAALSTHPNIVQIFKGGDCFDYPYFVLEYLPDSAQSLIEEREAGLDIDEALWICAEIAGALRHAHANGVLHRDIKPANILVDRVGHRVKLADFGLAHMIDASADSLAEVGSVSGSPPYMSPEQALGQAVDVRSDLFSLGVTLYELLCGERPFAGKSNAEILARVRNCELTPLLERMPSLDPRLLDLVNRAIAKSPNDRFESAAAMELALRSLLAPEGESTQNALDVKPVSNALSRRRHLLVASAAVFLLGIAGVAVWSFIPQDSGSDLARAMTLHEQGDYRAAAAAYDARLQVRPDDERALYGRAYALLQSGDRARARADFERLESSALKAEGLAAVALEENALAETRALLASPPRDASPYFYTLFARLHFLDGQYDEAMALLRDLDPDAFMYRWQYETSLELRAWASDGAHAPDAPELFKRLAQSENGTFNSPGDEYQAILARREEREEQQQLREEIGRLIDALGGMTGVGPGKAPGDVERWTSRPLYFVMNDPQGSQGSLARSKGLGERLPMHLEQALAGETPLKPVSRDSLAELLQEQHLSALLASAEGRLRLRELLAARIQITPTFLDAGGESVSFRIVDNETSQRFLTTEIPLAAAGLDTLHSTIFSDVRAAISKAYPIRGVVTLDEKNRTVLNIGSSAGVAPGMTFRIAGVPDLAQVFSGGVARVSEVAKDTSVIVLEGEGGAPFTGVEGGPYYAVDASWYEVHHP